MIEAVDIIIEDRAGVIYLITVAERIVSVVNEIAVIIIDKDKPVNLIVAVNMCGIFIFIYDTTQPVADFIVTVVIEDNIRADIDIVG